MNTDKIEHVAEQILCAIVYTIVKPITIVMDKLGMFEKVKAQKAKDNAIMQKQFDDHRAAIGDKLDGTTAYTESIVAGIKPAEDAT